MSNDDQDALYRFRKFKTYNIFLQLTPGSNLQILRW